MEEFCEQLSPDEQEMFIRMHSPGDDWKTRKDFSSRRDAMKGWKGRSLDSGLRDGEDWEKGRSNGYDDFDGNPDS